MASKTRLSTFATRLDVLLQGVQTGDLSAADRKLAIREAVQGYNRDLPRREIYEFAGDGGNYYVLHGKAVAIAASNRDQSIDLQHSGTSQDEQLSIKFTLSYESDLHEIRLFLMRVGATVAGTLECHLYTADDDGLPSQFIDSVTGVEIDEEEGPPRGYFRWVSFSFDPMVEHLPAGDYCAVLTSSSYSYADGSNEVQLGVDQSSVTNDMGTYNGSSWAAYGTDSQGIIEVVTSLPNWRSGLARLTDVEYPAAALGSDEQPTFLDDEEYEVYTAQSGEWLRFPSLAPSSSDDIRLRFVRPYLWVESTTDPYIGTPDVHFEAICNLAAATACRWLATRYAQNTDSTLNADVVQHRSQTNDYDREGKRFMETYRRLTGLDKEEGQPGAVFTDLDVDPQHPSGDFLFHRRSRR